MTKRLTFFNWFDLLIILFNKLCIFYNFQLLVVDHNWSLLEKLVLVLLIISILLQFS